MMMTCDGEEVNDKHRAVLFFILTFFEPIGPCTCVYRDVCMGSYSPHSWHDTDQHKKGRRKKR